MSTHDNLFVHPQNIIHCASIKPRIQIDVSTPHVRQLRGKTSDDLISRPSPHQPLKMDSNWTSNMTCCQQGPGSTTPAVLFQMPQEWRTVTSILAIAVVILAVTGNLVVMTMLVKSDVFSSEVNSSLLFSLCTADLLVALLVMPCAIDVVWSGQWRCGATWKHLNAFGNFWFCIASIMHLMVLSLDRYYAIVWPLRYPVHVTRQRAVMICVAAWLYSAIWALLPIVGVSSYECFIPYIGRCKEEDWAHKGLSVAFAVSVVTGTYGIALICMCYVHVKLYKIIRHHMLRAVPGRPSSSASGLFSVRRLSQGVVTLVLVILTYLACWSPFCLLLFAEIFKGEKAKGIAGMLTMLIGFSNSCCNPVIYVIRSRKFRVALRRWCAGVQRVRPTGRRPTSKQPAAGQAHAASNVDARRFGVSRTLSTNFGSRRAWPERR